MKDADFSNIPFSKVQSFGQRNLLHSDLFCVSWLLGRFCNYKCSYCWPYARADKKDHRPLDLLKKTMNEIKRQARKKNFNSFHFSFSGGEPTLHKGYLHLLKYYSADLDNSNYQSLHMTSNCSPGISWFKKYIATTKRLHRVSITASYHKEFTDKIKFRDKLILLQENDIQVTINMVLPPEKFSSLMDDAQYFHNSEINVTLKPQSNSTATALVAYTPEQLQILREGFPQKDYITKRLFSSGKISQRPKRKFITELNFSTKERVAPNMQVELTDSEGNKWYIDQAERFNSYDFNSFKGWECSAGYRSIIIREPDGYIKRSYSCNDKPLGHIETGFKLFDEIKTCETQSCVSSADSKIPKRRLGTEHPLWRTSLNKE